MPVLKLVESIALVLVCGVEKELPAAIRRWTERSHQIDGEVVEGVDAADSMCECTHL